MYVLLNLASVDILFIRLPKVFTPSGILSYHMLSFLMVFLGL